MFSSSVVVSCASLFSVLNNYKMPREWSTDTRDPWNAKIHSLLKTIDLHTKLYLETGDNFHNEQAKILRKYVYELKSWINKQEQLKENSNA
jgi:hypothetical protein